MEEFRGLGLTSRKNLCLHPSVRRERNGNVVDAGVGALQQGSSRRRRERRRKLKFVHFMMWVFLIPVVGGGSRAVILGGC